MHGRVVIMTGGTSGIGAEVAYELARRGAQLVLLTRHEPGDPFLVDYIDDLRARTKNQLIYAEQVDLASLHSIRKFATKWLDNAPPRRLDMIVLCAGTLAPPGTQRTETEEGIETIWQINFLANFHLLALLSPAIRAQPFDRDVRIVIPTCKSYISSPKLDDEMPKIQDRDKDKPTWTPQRAYARSKLALMTFARSYQKHLESNRKKSEEQLPLNARVILVDPGLARTPGTRRWLTRGSLWGLLGYLLLYWFVWLLLKAPGMAAQSILFAAFDGEIMRRPGGRLIKECMEVDCARADVDDEAVAKKLWETSDKMIEKYEWKGAYKRAREREEREEQEKIKEVEALVEAIKKGKEAQKKKEKEKKEKEREKKDGKKDNKGTTK